MSIPPVQLWSSRRERDVHDHRADFYAILLSTEQLERAYLRDAITHAEYSEACAKLITQFRTAKTLLEEDGRMNVEEFIRTTRLHCPAATHRLLTCGYPEPLVTQGKDGRDEGQGPRSAKHIAETVQHFITLMDALKLNLVAADAVHPLLGELASSLASASPSLDYPPLLKVREWLIQVNGMRASEELDAEQVRQLLFDLESAHTAFYRSLGGDAS
ncbi:MAG: vacuolar protein sorting-associated [Piptocephalis tieghemiana]|nr:MAG: vacuolar protein sorting-associated [Piptocephalis tieghemiana]